MSHQAESQVSVALAERDWRLITETILEECKSWGGDWTRWAEEIGSVIESAIQSAAVSSCESGEIAAGTRCAECGCSVHEFYHPGIHHMEYTCDVCGHSSSRSLTRWEMREYGDCSTLEDWELGMIDDW